MRPSGTEARSRLLRGVEPWPGFWEFRGAYHSWDWRIQGFGALGSGIRGSWLHGFATQHAWLENWTGPSPAMPTRAGPPARIPTGFGPIGTASGTIGMAVGGSFRHHIFDKASVIVTRSDCLTVPGDGSLGACGPRFMNVGNVEL